MYRQRLWLVAALLALVAAVSAPLALADAVSATVTDAGLERHGLVSDDLVEWTDIEQVEVGCALVCQRDTVRYDLRAEDGGVLSALHGCPSRQQLEALDRLDARIRSHGIPRVRASHDDGRPFWDERCTERVAGQTGFDRERLDRLVSVD